MRWFFAIGLIIFGAFLFALTIDNIGVLGNIIMNIIGFVSIFVAGLIVRGKRENNNS